MENQRNQGRAPGRPRDPEVEQRILDGALRHLARDGYSRMSVDSIASEAGASKPTIYRRWRTKADLATAALHTLPLAEPPVDTGSTTDDLCSILQNFRRSLLRRNGMTLIGTVLAEEAHTPELLALFRERLVAPRREMIRTVLERARRDGELRDNVDTGTVGDMLVGAFYAHYLVWGSVPAGYPARLVAMLWQGIRKRSIMISCKRDG